MGTEGFWKGCPLEVRVGVELKDFWSFVVILKCIMRCQPDLFMRKG